MRPYSEENEEYALEVAVEAATCLDHRAKHGLDMHIPEICEVECSCHTTCPHAILLRWAS